MGNKNKNTGNQIKTGWAWLDEKTKVELKSKGIHPLQHTPGKLITAKGHIDGYLSAYGIVTGKISATGATAQKMMGFTPKQGAKGVKLCHRRYVDDNGKVKSGIFATSLMPYKGSPTPKQKINQDKVALVANIVHNHMKDIIYPIWEPLVINKYRKPYDGPLYFQSFNQKIIGSPPKWKKLLISNGTLQSPTYACASSYYDPRENKIYLSIHKTIKGKPLTIRQFGIGILDRITGDFLHISPDQIMDWATKRTDNPSQPPAPMQIVWQLKQIFNHYDTEKLKALISFARFYIYFYFKEMKTTAPKQPETSIKEKPALSQFSPSVCSRIRAYTEVYAKNNPRSKKNPPSIEITVLVPPTNTPLN